MSPDSPPAVVMRPLPPAPPAVTTTVTSRFDCLPALEREWQALYATSETEPTTSFEWTQALARTHVDPSNIEAGYVVQLRRELTWSASFRSPFAPRTSSANGTSSCGRSQN